MDIGAEKIKLINEHLIEKIAPYLIVLFGSAASGRMHSGSDIDIAFLSDKDLSAYEVFMIAQELADILDRDVDLVNLQQASTVFQAQVVGSGKIIYCSDDNRRMQFEMLTLKKYARLNEERRCIIEQITRRGSIYE
ncbi:nucleotidyltransferase domain-containing protein [Peptococcaceae bacterium 1198_IL3148]